MNFISKQRLGNKVIISFFGIKFRYKDKTDTFLNDIFREWENSNNPKKLVQYLEKILEVGVENKNREIYLIYISMLIENKQQRKAKQHLNKYVTKYGTRDLYAFPVICNMAAKCSYSDAKIIDIAHVFEVLERNKKDGYLASLLDNKSIAIVGNSPNLLGKQKGVCIDSHDIVVRFNNYKIKGFETDYGSKTNIWVCCQADDVVNLSENEVKQLDYVLYNIDLWHAKLSDKCFQNISENIERKEMVGYIESKYIQNLKQCGFLCPSTGLATIYYFHKLVSLKRNNIFGFSFLENNSNFYEHYFTRRSKSKIKKFIKNGHHNFAKESIFLNKLLEE